MMRILATVIAVCVGLIALSRPALAFDVPTQGSSNATDVINWYGDNLTINVNDLETAAEAGAQVIADAHTATGNQFLGLFGVLALLALTFWQRTIILYVLATSVSIMYGLKLAGDNTSDRGLWALGVTIAVIGTYCLWKAGESGIAWAKKRAATN